jgi:hypothetical protein
VRDAEAAPDLDFRPAEPARSEMLAWVQRCGTCGYCGMRVDGVTDEIRAVVFGQEYRAQLSEDGMPELARSLLCIALIGSTIGFVADAARCAIEAAWVCDDEDASDAASRCRARAVELMFECEAEGDELFSDPHVDQAVIVDLLRRSGRFDEAVALADENLEEAGGDIAAILSFSRSLALAEDVDAHAVDDVAPAGTDDRSIVEALKQLEVCRERGEYNERFVVLDADEHRHYYVQFAVDEGGLFCEVVHNKYLADEHAFTGDDIATLLALGFAVPEAESQNFFRVFEPTSDGDFDAIVGLVRTVVTDFFGLPSMHPLRMSTAFGEPARS